MKWLQEMKNAIVSCSMHAVSYAGGMVDLELIATTAAPLPLFPLSFRGVCAGIMQRGGSKLLSEG